MVSPDSEHVTGTSLAKSKRIASNTMLLFLRMFVIMVINLYAVRIVLRALGITDYGIYNTIAGVVFMSTFLTSTLALSIQRFYSYAIGKGTLQRLPEIFSASMNIVFLLIIIILVIFETFGLWFVNTQLTIPPDRLTAALWVYQFAIGSFIFSLLQIPYTAAIFSHEDMGYYAFISSLECLGRLLVAFMIGVVLIDGLVFYGAGLLLVACCVFLAYFLICRHYYTECHYQKVRTTGIYHELMSFSGWTMYGTIAGVSMIQGSAILLNIFFGPIANAAYSISNQVYNALNALNNSTVLAFRPAMIKAFAESRYDFLNRLFYINNKVMFYTLCCVALPAILEMSTILNWWLAKTTDDMILFSQLFVVYLVLMALHNPITTIVQATGRVKHYYLIVESMTICCLPLTWLCYQLGAASYWLFCCMIGICIIAHIARLVCLHQVYPAFSYRQYLLSLVLPATLITLCSALVAIGIHNSISQASLRFWVVVVTIPLIILLLALFVGISKEERTLLRTFINQLKRK